MTVSEISICAQQGKAHRAQVKHTFQLGKANAPKTTPAPVKTAEPEKKEVSVCFLFLIPRSLQRAVLLLFSIDSLLTDLIPPKEVGGKQKNAIQKIRERT